MAATKRFLVQLLGRKTPLQQSSALRSHEALRTAKVNISFLEDGVRQLVNVQTACLCPEVCRGVVFVGDAQLGSGQLGQMCMCLGRKCLLGGVLARMPEVNLALTALAGQVRQQGVFDNLLAEDGLFARMMERQIA